MASTSRVTASSESISETLYIFSNILSRPITEKQLARPTFEFIQGIIRSLISETRILRDVFSPSDFGLGNRQAPKSLSKRAKTEFMQRLIDHTARTGKPVVGCVAAKVVDGLDPTKTNELLQALGRLALARIEGREALNKRPRTFTRSLAKRGNQNESVQQSKVTHRRGSNSLKPSAAAELESDTQPEPESLSSGYKSNQDGRRQSNSEFDRATRVGNENSPKSKASAEEKDASTYQFASSTENSLKNADRSVTGNTNRQSGVTRIINENDVNAYFPKLESNLNHLRSTTIVMVKDLDEQMKAICFGGN